ncbi:DUF973 family protein [Sulfolobus sp. S-194]|uniref:DUF973 family protein n=1 Tax=Sulfolobus sp. S-194 TaxID=2512240 RepID=UPI001437171C|nr:DUF973 family protein [Sulfolobus sp. S-194]QIW24451.1 DUF973 family protein [Sulfolobus sp. S-194]
MNAKLIFMIANETREFSKLRNAFILLTVTEIVYFSSIIIETTALLQALTTTGNLTSLSGLFASLFLQILALILGLISGIFLYSGFRNLTAYKSSADTGSLLVIIASVFIPIFAIISIILFIIGFALIRGGLDKIASTYNEDLIKHGAVLNIFPVISIIGFIITAIGLNRIRNKQLTITSGNRQVEEIGLGTIRANGYIYLTLDSKIIGTIVSAKIEGTRYTALLSIPLTIGINNIVINIGTPISLTPAIYTVTLVIATGYSTYTETLQAIYNP